MNRANCYFESIESTFQFGKYRGMLLCTVIIEDPSYIHWCVNHINEFLISETALTQIRELFPEFIITHSFRGHIGNYDYDEDYEKDDEWQDDDDVPTYGRFSGSYAQDEMGYSDDDIDTIFDGDPSAYWNID